MAAIYAFALSIFYNPLRIVPDMGKIAIDPHELARNIFSCSYSVFWRKNIFLECNIKLVMSRWSLGSRHKYDEV